MPLSEFARYFRNVRQLVVVLLMLMSVISCNDDNHPIGKGSMCTLSSFSHDYEGMNNRVSISGEFTYDGKGNRIGSFDSDLRTNTFDGSTTREKTVTTNDYDDDGFLLQRIADHTYKAIAGVVPFVKETTNYTYENQRLVKIDFTRLYSSAGSDHNITTYQYSIDGKVIKFDTSDGSTTIEYDGTGNPSKMTTLNTGGSTNVSTYEINSMGFVTRIFKNESDGATSEYLYKLDEVGQVLHLEFRRYGKPVYDIQNEYDHMHSIVPFIDPPIKGRPNLQFMEPQLLSKNNIIKTTYREPVFESSEWRTVTVKTYQFDYNSNGIPLRESNVYTFLGEVQATEHKSYGFNCSFFE